MAEVRERPTFGSCFVIATRNRSEHLLEAVRCITSQTVLPSELCIVDSSEVAPAREEIERLCDEAGVRLEYVQPAPRGLTVQRNLGIERTTGDPVFLIDDDVTFADDVHEEILAEYARWGPELGGVRGEATVPQRPARSTILWRRFFGMGGWWPEASGRMRAGFYVEGVSTSASVRRLEYFNGWFMSFRREVFEHERFDENLAGYAFKEDVDLSYRVVKRGYVLVQTPRARITHHKSPSERLSVFDQVRMAVANQFYLHRKNMPQTLRYRAALWWALLGTLPLHAGKVLQTRDPGWLTGFLFGAWEQARGRGLIDPAGERERRVTGASA
jgi:glycosyltransferase involved in cell wall biosynthesis